MEKARKLFPLIAIVVITIIPACCAIWLFYNCKQDHTMVSGTLKANGQLVRTLPICNLPKSGQKWHALYLCSETTHNPENWRTLQNMVIALGKNREQIQLDHITTTRFLAANPTIKPIIMQSNSSQEQLLIFDPKNRLVMYYPIQDLDHNAKSILTNLQKLLRHNPTKYF